MAARKVNRDDITDPKTLLRDLSAGKFKPAYYFFGSEDFRIAEAQKYVASQFLPRLQQAVNFRKFDGRKTKAGDLIAQLSNLPMLGEKQVFVVSDIQSYRGKELEGILKLIDPSDVHRIVIFATPSAREPKRGAAVFSQLAEVAELVEFRRLSARDTNQVIGSRLKKENMEIEPEALKLLSELICGNMGALESEVAKLIDYKGAGQTITVEDVKQVSSGFEVFRMFDLADVIVDGNTGKVLKMINLLLAEGTPCSTLLILLQQHFSSLYLVKNSKSPLGRRNFPWLVAKFRSQAAKYSNDNLERMIKAIAEADADLRKPGLKPDAVVEVLAMGLTDVTKSPGLAR